ncbi:MAG: thiamine ABC transporter substrate-binding protein [Chloroflexota bacterium]|nr:thiamine ABC transporter substrate-binding protein [Chloroflexota bacterium]
MKVSIRWLALLSLVMLLLVACAGDVEEEPLDEPAEPAVEEVVEEEAEGVEDEPQVLEEEAEVVEEEAVEGEARVVRLVTHESFNATEEVLDLFEEEYNAEIQIVPLGDTGQMVNQSILSKNNPLGDVMFGIDNTFLSRALEEELFVPYESPNLGAVQEEFIIDPEHRVTPIDYGDVCLNYDIDFFENFGLPAPTTLEDLVEPEYEGMTVVQNPATSSPGLAFLLATVGHFGEDGWEEYWAALRDNDVLVTSGWSEAYFEHFTEGGGEGDRPIVVSYASSPPFTGGTTASVVGDESCFRQIEFAGVLQNAENPELAQALIDFMLTEPFQNDVPQQMFVFPVIEDATLPESFMQSAQVPENPVTLDPEFIEENRDELIERWTEIVLR